MIYGNYSTADFKLGDWSLDQFNFILGFAEDSGTLYTDGMLVNLLLGT